VGLSRRERLALFRLESQLSREAPALAAYLAPAWRQRVPLRRAGFLLRVVLPLLVGVQVAAAGGMAGSRVLIMLGLFCAVLGPGGALAVDARRRQTRTRRRAPSVRAGL
jgi:hypothetical protein